MSRGEGEAFRSGLVTIVGRPNVGKSTLLNRLTGRKLAITSEKPQTTRNRITGIVNRERSQVVLIDTPGLHKPRTRLGDYMVSVTLSALREIEAVLFVVEVNQTPGPGDRYVAERLADLAAGAAPALPATASTAATPATAIILTANKADLCSGETMRRNLEAYRDLGSFAAVLPVSALRDESFELLLRTIEGLLPEGPRYYPEDVDTDQPEAFIIAELVREKLLALTREEVPHSVAVAVEEMRAGAGRNETGPEMLYVRAVVYVERESQKGIIVGARGSLLGEAGRLARREIEAVFGVKVYLDLWVKVEKDWRDRSSVLRALGYSLPRD